MVLGKGVERKQYRVLRVHGVSTGGRGGEVSQMIKTSTYGTAKLIQDIVEELDQRGEDVPAWKDKEVMNLLVHALMLLRGDRRTQDRRKHT